MDKKEFLSKLRKSLSELPPEEVEERIDFYEEMIDDCIEEGMSEEEAVALIGKDVEATVPTNEPKVSNEVYNEDGYSKRKLTATEIILLIVGFPIWLPLVAVGFSLLVSLYAVLWSGVISIWSGFAAVAASVFSSIVSAVMHGATGTILPCVALAAAALALVGLSILMFYLCVLVTKWSAVLSAMPIKGIKKLYRKWRSA